MKAVCIFRRAVAQQFSVGRKSAGDLEKTPQIHITEKKIVPVPSQSKADLGHSAPPPPGIFDK